MWLQKHYNKKNEIKYIARFMPNRNPEDIQESHSMYINDYIIVPICKLMKRPVYIIKSTTIKDCSIKKKIIKYKIFFLYILYIFV